MNWYGLFFQGCYNIPGGLLVLSFCLLLRQSLKQIFLKDLAVQGCMKRQNADEIFASVEGWHFLKKFIYLRDFYLAVFMLEQKYGI